MFGNGFLSKFQGAQLDAPLLHHVTLIDTPGILSGEKQRIGRSPLLVTSLCVCVCVRCGVSRMSRWSGRAAASSMRCLRMLFTVRFSTSTKTYTDNGDDDGK